LPGSWLPAHRGQSDPAAEVEANTFLLEQALLHQLITDSSSP
jgi:hypothetical protein